MSRVRYWPTKKVLRRTRRLRRREAKLRRLHPERFVLSDMIKAELWEMLKGEEDRQILYGEGNR